jgi:hypothetical protein
MLENLELINLQRSCHGVLETWSEKWSVDVAIGPVSGNCVSDNDTAGAGTAG